MKIIQPLLTGYYIIIKGVGKWKKQLIFWRDIKKGSFLAFFKNIVLSSIVKAPISYKETYSSAVESDSNSNNKLIPIKDNKANTLMITGKDDQLWDSLSMANEIKSQLPDSKLLSYKDAGHIFGGSDVLNLESMRIKTGGSLEGNKNVKIYKVLVFSLFNITYHIIYII